MRRNKTSERNSSELLSSSQKKTIIYCQPIAEDKTFQVKPWFGPKTLHYPIEPCLGNGFGCYSHTATFKTKLSILRFLALIESASKLIELQHLINFPMTVFLLILSIVLP